MKIENCKIENCKSNIGFTLIELLIYIAIFAVTVGMLSGILATFVRIQGQEAASASVTQELSFVLTTIQRLVRESVNIENPAGAASSTLTLRMASSTLDPTIISSDGNAINLQQGVGATKQPLTSDRVSVSQFEVVKYENPGGHAVVQVDLSLTYNSQRLYQQLTRNLKTSIGRITAATFDDNLMPNQNNQWSIGVSPYLWKNAAFSGNLTVGGNVGIGTTTPGYKLQIVGGNDVSTQIKSNGYIEDVGGIVGSNYIPSHSWAVGSGSVGIFSQNGQTSENVRDWGVGPHENETILWIGGNDAASDADGGWGTSFFAVDPAKTYRFTVWIKKTGSNDGSTYFGTGGSPSYVTSLAGVENSNPYFWSGDLPSLDKWYFLVGYIQSKDDSNTSSRGGIYDGETGRKVQSITDFKLQAGTTSLRHRAYLYYDVTTSDRQYFWDPRVEEVYGKEPSIEALLGSGKFATESKDAYFGGNVGIGTTGPGAKLDVAGSIRTQGGDGTGLQLLNTGTNTYYGVGAWGNRLEWYRNQGGNYYWAMLTSEGGKWRFNGYADSTGPLLQVIGDTYISGNVGIGTTDPGTYKLYINGTGYLNAAAWVYGSDIRLKENISYLQSGLNVIENLKPAQFDFIDGDKKQVGFIAQDVRGVLPDIVTEGSNGMLGMKTDSIIPYLVKAIQEQQKEIEELKEKLNGK